MCVLLQHEVKYLEHVVGRDGVVTDPENVQTVKDWTVLRDPHKLQTFLGLVEYYRQSYRDLQKWQSL